MRVFFDEIRANKRKTVLLFFFFFILITILGLAIGYFWGSYETGLLVTAIFGVIYALIAWYAGGDMIMAMTGAKQVTKKEFPHLFHAVEGLALAGGLPTPKCYVISDSALNAFATGKDPKHAAIAVTTGLMAKLNRQELEGVIAHEMSHIKHYDIRVMMLASILVGIVAFLSDLLLRSMLFGGGGKRDNDGGVNWIAIVIGLALALLSPVVAIIIRQTISRKREFAADAGAVQLTRYPAGLANALKKIKGDPDPLVDTANNATAHLFISTPFRKSKHMFSNLFATHPPIDERIKRLEAM
jgi:heat shock protein HtpX